MTYPISFDWDVKLYDLDVKQDVETYIDWDVDTDIKVDIDKDIDVKIDVDTDVKDQGSVLTAVIKDIAGNADDVAIIADTTSVEDALSTAELTAQTSNTVAQLTASALDKTAAGLSPNGYLDSGTFAEISLGIDTVQGEFSVITLSMEALVDG